AAAEIVVALNLDGADHPFSVQFPADGTWLRFRAEEGVWEYVTVNGGELAVTLEASSGMVFVREDGATGIN
ncbi:MAG TPA: hypothetical protein P5571_13805, partial [Candidatus Krumholzibacteria bacterium]|nr:hypothetical protein [Candidatus Krumholzibacteria bacterium]HRX52440.1 hypothetical protein [Candidatus Krumholzibacteria bacterium]